MFMLDMVIKVYIINWVMVLGVIVLDWIWIVLNYNMVISLVSMIEKMIVVM